jgi:hypothetical protein
MAEGSYSQAVPSLFFRPPTLDDLEAIHAIEVTRMSFIYGAPRKRQQQWQWQKYCWQQLMPSAFL